MNRPDLLKRTLDSISRDAVDKALYEVIISDNSDDLRTLELVNSYESVNITYFKNDVKGFYNSINTLLNANGDFLKLHNDYTTFLPGMFRQFVEDVNNQFDENSILLFTNGELSGSNISHTFNDFIKFSHFYTTWSSAFSINAKQLKATNHNRDELDEMFPHTSLLFNVSVSNYIVIDEIYFKNIQVEKKGGYNIFYNFGVLFLDMLEAERNRKRITTITYFLVKYKLLIQFLSPWYYKTVETSQGYTFDISNVRNHITSKYGLKGYVIVVSLSKFNKLLKLFHIR